MKIVSFRASTKDQVALTELTAAMQCTASEVLRRLIHAAKLIRPPSIGVSQRRLGKTKSHAAPDREHVAFQG